MNDFEILHQFVEPFSAACYALDRIESQLHSLTEENERAEDFRAEIVIEAFTAPDADWGTILDSLRSRIADALSRASEAEQRAARYEETLRRLAELNESWVITDNVRGTHLVKMARLALSPIDPPLGQEPHPA